MKYIYQNTFTKTRLMMEEHTYKFINILNNQPQRSGIYDFEVPSKCKWHLEIICPSCHVAWKHLSFLLGTKSWILLSLPGLSKISTNEGNAQFQLESSERKRVLLFSIQVHRLPGFYPWARGSVALAVGTPKPQPSFPSWLPGGGEPGDRASFCLCFLVHRKWCK